MSFVRVNVRQIECRIEFRNGLDVVIKIEFCDTIIYICPYDHAVITVFSYMRQCSLCIVQ